MNILNAMRAEGLPESICCVQGLMDGFDYTSGLGGSSSVSKHNDMKKIVNSVVQSRVGLEVKCIQEENCALLIRSISVCIPHDISWKKHRSYILSDKTIILPSDNSSDLPASMSVKVSGYLRGAPMNVNSLMHIVGVGSCRIVSVSNNVSPYEAGRKHGLVTHTAEVVYTDSTQ